jgi:hypothetical protein
MKKNKKKMCQYVNRQLATQMKSLMCAQYIAESLIVCKCFG